MRRLRVWLAGLAAMPAMALAQADPAALVPPEPIRTVEPVYPPAMEDKGVGGAVVVEIDVDLQGKVKAVKVAQSAGPEFDAAALQAARQMEFSPARQAGKPVAVRITWRFQFGARVAATRRDAAPGQNRFDRRDIERAPAGFSSLDGQVLERGTGRPVVGATVTVAAQGAEVTTDGDGRFRFGLLRAGPAEVYLPGTDHKPLRHGVQISDGKTTTVRLRAERLSYTVYRASAVAPPEAGQMARRTLGAEEIQRIPGVQGDAFKVVQNLPGVARGTGGSGFLVVRGSAPLDTLIAVEGVRVPLIYHFGGVYSIINTDLLDSIDFYPGGFSARFGRQTGGLLNARLALPKKQDHWHGYLESNVYHTGFLLQGPIGENTTVAAAARRSYIDAFLSMDVIARQLPLTLAPRYWDYQLKLDHRLSDRTSMSWFWFGSDDALTAVLKNPPAAFPQARGELASRTSFHTLIGILRHSGDDWTSNTTLGATYGILDAAFGDIFRAEGTSREYTLRQDFTFGKGPLQLRPGLDIFCNPFAVEIYAPPIQTTGERGTFGGGGAGVPTRRIQVRQSGVFVSPAAYFDAVFNLRPDLEVVPGMRLDLFRGGSGGEALTPRLNLRWSADAQWTLKAAAGERVQRPQPNEVGQRFGNPSLLPSRSFEVAAGAEYKISDAVDVDVQFFRKDLSNLVVYPKGVVPEPPINAGTGRILGAELLVRHKPVGPFFGWIAYTLQQALRRDEPHLPERPFGWDQTHILTMLGSYKLPDNWEVGARFRWVTGNPTTPLSTAVYNEANDTYTRVQSAELFTDRLPAFHQLDLRVDKKFVFEDWLFNVYLDIQNVYNHGNPEGIQYNYDATAQQYQTGLPIIPSLGLRGEF
ncbi:MAG: TonB-dependent receptor [Deltaproteobacteria bacterium]|nr:TonB-dependent receptor [Deltaproteobacteria bacterium]